jgi:hypothetical protein
VATALTFGSAFHNAIEAYLKDERENRKPLAQYWRRHWNEAIERDGLENIDWSDGNPDTHFQNGLSMLTADTIQQTLDEIEPLRDDKRAHIEDRIELQVPGVPIPLIGYIDIITADGVPGDFKTASRKWWGDKADKSMQPTFYLAALNQNGYELNTDMAFKYYIFTKTKNPAAQILSTKRTNFDLVWLFDMVLETWRAIEAEHFPPNPTGWKCSEKYCEFWNICRGAG